MLERLARLTAAGWAACVAVGLAAGGLGSPELRATLAEDGPGCPLRALTGIPCAFCGMTRATLALGDGDVAGALALHPLAPLVLVATLGLSLAIAAGRADALVGGRRPALLLLTVAAIWLVRLARPVPA